MCVWGQACLQHEGPSFPGGLAGLALPGRHCLSCYWNLAPWFTGALCSHMCSAAQESHSPHQAGCRQRPGCGLGSCPAPAPAGDSAAGHQPVQLPGLMLQMQPIRSQHRACLLCSPRRGWAQAAQPQVTGAHLQPGAEERAAVPSAAASAWQVCGAGEGGPCLQGGGRRPEAQ